METPFLEEKTPCLIYLRKRPRNQMVLQWLFGRLVRISSMMMQWFSKSSLIMLLSKDF